MSKAEDYILENMKSGLITGWDDQNRPICQSWLTPDQARTAVEIARKEMISKACDWLKENVTYIHPRKGITKCIVNLNAFKEAMED